MNTENNTPINIHIDATGLTCPVPLMMLKKAIDGLQMGDVLHIDVTDVHAELDFEIWCEKFGHRLECLEGNQDVMSFLVCKGAGIPPVQQQD